MFPRLAPMRLSKHLNEKGRKKNGGINDEGVQKKKRHSIGIVWT